MEKNRNSLSFHLVQSHFCLGAHAIISFPTDRAPGDAEGTDAGLIPTFLITSSSSAVAGLKNCSIDETLCISKGKLERVYHPRCLGRRDGDVHGTSYVLPPTDTVNVPLQCLHVILLASR